MDECFSKLVGVFEWGIPICAKREIPIGRFYRLDLTGLPNIHEDFTATIKLPLTGKLEGQGGSGIRVNYSPQISAPSFVCGLCDDYR
jgi:hypothetical protein